MWKIILVRLAVQKYGTYILSCPWLILRMNKNWFLTKIPSGCWISSQMARKKVFYEYQLFQELAIPKFKLLRKFYQKKKSTMFCDKNSSLNFIIISKVVGYYAPNQIFASMCEFPIVHLVSQWTPFFEAFFSVKDMMPKIGLECTGSLFK